MAELTKTKRAIFALSVADWRMAYIYSRKGYRLKPIVPRWIRKRIVSAWNKIVCAIRGHDRVLESIPEAWGSSEGFHCVHCCAFLKPRTS